MNDSRNTEERPTDAGARAGLPALYAEMAQISDQAERLAARLRMHHTKVANTVCAITGQDMPAALQDGQIGIEISIPAPCFGYIEGNLIDRMQAKDSSLTIDDCFREIFMTGMASMTLRLDRTHPIATRRQDQPKESND